MARVKNLVIRLQSGSDNLHFATWEFEEQQKFTTSTGAIQVGDYVRVKSGSKWYNGVGIASFVFNEEWKVIEIRGDRVVLGSNRNGNFNIQSPIHISNLDGGSGQPTYDTKDTLDHYTVVWAYDTGDGVWFSGGSSSDTKERYATYSAPSNATRVRVTVTPVSVTRKVNDQDTPYWTGEAVSTIYALKENPPEVPPVPDVEVEKYELIATVNNISDPRTDSIEFEVYDGVIRFKSAFVTVRTAMASFKCNINAGGSYRVRVRATNTTPRLSNRSAWTDFTSAVTTIPTPPSAITKIRGNSTTSVYLEWTAVNSAETYDIEYTTKLNYFDGSNETTVISDIEFNHYEVTGLETGEEYFFRVRAVNEKGESSWSEIKSVVIGKKPSAPTTWSSATTVITGEALTLYWVHNAEDGSSETFAELELYINGRKESYTIENKETDEDEKDKTKFYKVDTKSYIEGTKIEWRVRTAGITKQYGDWSIKRTVDIYAPPTLELSVTDQNGSVLSILKEFPFFIKGLAGPKTQMPIGYHVSVTADLGYETVDVVGRTAIINPGDEVYGKYIDTNDPLLLEMNAFNIDLENNIPYTVTVTVSMNSGLIATESVPLEVSWVDEQFALDAEIAVDLRTYVAYITPYCRDENGAPIPDMSLSVYRREFDGTFTELAVGIDSTKNTVVTDPHPALDYARYRIVAIANSTGAVSFYDPPGYPVGGKAVVIQWDERWTDFDVTNTDERVQPAWVGSLLELPYNIDISDSNKSDSTLVQYIGRTYPVSYYGTQIDSNSTWNMDVPKEDKETIYALRRLSIYKGDVYVREPSGTGYWANIQVSFSIKHTEVKVPVTFDITRVDGGV